jgi:hypothetical protein
MRVAYNGSMTDTSDPHSLLVQRLTEAAEREGVRARASMWRGKSQRERSRAFVGLMRMSVIGARGGPRPYTKPPLRFPRFSSVEDDRG